MENLHSLKFRKLLLENFHQAGIDFHGDEPAGLSGDLPCQNAEAGADFHDNVFRRCLCGLGDFTHRIRIRQEGLAASFIGANPVPAKNFPGCGHSMLIPSRFPPETGEPEAIAIRH